MRNRCKNAAAARTLLVSDPLLHHNEVSLKVWGSKSGRMGLSRYVGLGTAAAGLILCVACSPASVAFRNGRKAELRRDYDSAVVDFDKALHYQPENPDYQIYEKEARVKASFLHLAQGRRLLAQHRENEAAGEFQRAVSVDPTDQAAAQELDRLAAKQAARLKAQQEALKKAMETRTTTAPSGEIQLQPLPQEPIAHLHISADSRKVFETLGKLANLNVVFYHDFQPRPISLDLTNIKIADAIQVAAYEANAFWKPVTPNTILVIPDTPNNRRMLQNEVLKTVYLSNPLTPADRTAILSALKQVVGAQQVFDNPEANAIIIRDTPQKVKAAEELIRSLDLGKAEVLVDVTVLEADRDRIRDLGLSPIPLGTPNASTLAVFGYSPPNVSATATTTPAISLNTIGKVTSSYFSIALPGLMANALLTDTDTKILQSPQVRVTDGMTAKLTIGSRVPIATGSFGVPTGTTTGAGFGLLANTQFTYQDVGVKMEITPHVSTDGEISLHTHVTISAESTPVNIGGIEEPTFTQRDIEHDIRLEDGEASLLGGLIQTQTTRSVTGLPGLGEVPILKYLFSTTNYEKNDQELLIMMTPHVIRLPENASEATASVNGSSVPARPQMPFRLPGRPR